MAGAAAIWAAPLHAQEQTPLNLDDGVLQPFSVVPLQGLEDVPAPSLETLQGQTTVLNFWASWCEGCQDEHRFLLELGQKGARLAGIATFDKQDAALHYLEKAGNPFAFVGLDDTHALTAMLGVTSLPRTFLIGPNAQILWRTSEGLDDDLMADLLSKIESSKG